MSGARLSQSNGFTMIELLISMFVVAVGVLGVAALQLTTLANLQLSQQYGVAAMLADEMAERMTANPVAARDNEYDHTAAPKKIKDCAAKTCSSKEMAEYDQAEWQEEIAASLYAGAGSVDEDGTTNTFVITVFWDEDYSGSTGKNCPTKNDDDLDCYQTTVGF